MLWGQKTSKLNFLFDLIKNPATRFYYLSAHGFYHSMSDEDYIKRLWKYKMKKPLDLENPKTICEKLQWLRRVGPQTGRHDKFTKTFIKH